MTPHTIEQILKLVANRVHIGRLMTPYMLRHMFAVTAIYKGISLPALQRLLDHDRLTTTEIYLNLSRRGMSNALPSRLESTPPGVLGHRKGHPHRTLIYPAGGA